MAIKKMFLKVQNIKMQQYSSEEIIKELELTVYSVEEYETFAGIKRKRV